jgi:uncharacterized phage protein (TIGR02216 family)
MPQIDWPALMRAGMQQRGLAPDVFWGMTPSELMILCGLHPSAPPMRRSRLDHLMAQYPD